MTDESMNAAPDIEADLRQLRCLAGARLAADDHDLVRFDGARDFSTPRDDRQFIRIGRARQVREPLLGIQSPYRFAHVTCSGCGIDSLEAGALYRTVPRRRRGSSGLSLLRRRLLYFAR